MRAFYIIFLGLFLAASAFAGGDGHGGGGVYRNGQYITFYSAGLYVLPTQLQAEGPHSVPGLRSLMDYLNQTPYLSEETKAVFLTGMEPSFSRKYYEVDESRFTKQTLAKIKAEYAKVVHISADDVVLYAVTDPSSKVTYLLPDFYKLDTKQQEVILYHEANWVLNPDASYKTIVQNEMAFQAFLENPYLADNLMNWLVTIGSNSDLLKASIKFDLQTGALAGLIVNQTQIPLKTLLGDDFFQCKDTELKEWDQIDCTARIQTNLFVLSGKYPNSMLLRLLRDKFAANNVVITSWNSGAVSVLSYSLLDDDDGIGDPSTGVVWNDSTKRWERLDAIEPFELGYLDLSDTMLNATLRVDLVQPPITAGHSHPSLTQYYLIINSN